MKINLESILVFYRREDAGLKQTMQNDEDLVTDLNVKAGKKKSGKTKFN